MVRSFPTYTPFTCYPRKKGWHFRLQWQFFTWYLWHPKNKARISAGRPYSNWVPLLIVGSRVVCNVWNYAKCYKNLMHFLELCYWESFSNLEPLENACYITTQLPTLGFPRASKFQHKCPSFFADLSRKNKMHFFPRKTLFSAHLSNFRKIYDSDPSPSL